MLKGGCSYYEEGLLPHIFTKLALRLVQSLSRDVRVSVCVSAPHPRYEATKCQSLNLRPQKLYIFRRPGLYKHR